MSHPNVVARQIVERARRLWRAFRPLNMRPMVNGGTIGWRTWSSVKWISLVIGRALCWCGKGGHPLRGGKLAVGDPTHPSFLRAIQWWVLLFCWWDCPMCRSCTWWLSGPKWSLSFMDPRSISCFLTFFYLYRPNGELSPIAAGGWGSDQHKSCVPCVLTRNYSAHAQ